MVMKLTIVGRVSDGLPLSQGTRYVNDDDQEDYYYNLPAPEYNSSYSTYLQQAEFLLSDISRAPFSYSARMIIGINQHHCFSYIIENGICFMTLTDSSYPRKLVFFFLEDLANEFHKLDQRIIIQKITKPYSFVKFGGIIRNIRRQYADTRTQSNLSKLNNAKSDNHDNIITQEFSQIVKRRNRHEMLQKLTRESDHVPYFQDSKTLEVIALKWTPITILFVVAATLFFARFSIRDHEFIMYTS